MVKQNLCNRDRQTLWQNGRCPECGSKDVTSKDIAKDLRGSKKPLVGKEYECGECGCVNQFTWRV